MIVQKVLIGLGVTLLAAWSAGPALAGAQCGQAGWSQMTDRSAMEPEEMLMAAGGDEEEFGLGAPHAAAWRGLRQAAMQDREQEEESTNQEGIAGRVYDFFTSRVPGEAALHVLAKIDTPIGIAAVDLGPTNQVPRLQPGEFVHLRGFWGQVNDRNVFVTTRLSNGQRTVHVFVTSQRPNVRQIEGEVLATYTITSDQTGHQLRFARLRTDDGRMRIVNLGPASDTAALNLEPGNQITAIGRPIGLLRFRAYEVNANGHRVAIDWGAAARNWAAERFQTAAYPEEE